MAKSKETDIKLSDLIPDDKNFNKGSEYGNGLIEKSFSKFGAGRSILIDKNNRIIAGNKSVENAMSIGLDDVQIVESDGKRIIAVKRMDIDLDTPQGREMALADNASAKANIVFDAELIEAELGEATAVEWGIEVADKLEAEEDDFDVPDGGLETDIVLGDLFEIGQHRLLCGDSTDSDAVAKLMNGNKAELLFTSPPYSDMREYNGEKDLSVSNLVEFITSFYQYCEYQVINLGIQRKNNDINEYWNDYIIKARDNGYKFLSWNVWAKPSAGSIGNQSAFFPIAHEWIFVFGKKFKDINRTCERTTSVKKERTHRKVRQADGSMKNSTVGFQGALKEMESVFYSNPELGAIRKDHPATFPIELPSEYIKAITNEGDLIAEPFTGSGSTMAASHQLNRKCYGMELDPKYCQVIVNRMIKLDPSLEIKKNGVKYEHTTES
jgi:DNA modification methylase